MFFFIKTDSSSGKNFLNQVTEILAIFDGFSAKMTLLTNGMTDFKFFFIVKLPTDCRQPRSSSVENWLN